MSIAPINNVFPIQPAQAARATGVTATFAATRAGAAVTIDALPASPPAEVLAEMRTAAAAADSLAAQGQSIRFSTDPESGRVTAALTDADGNTTSSLSLHDVLAVAGGATL